MPKKENNKSNKEVIVRKKIFCPICGSAAIRPVKRRFRCLNCKARFSKPKKTKKN